MIIANENVSQELIDHILEIGYEKNKDQENLNC